MTQGGLKGGAGDSDRTLRAKAMAAKGKKMGQKESAEAKSKADTLAKNFDVDGKPDSIRTKTKAWFASQSYRGYVVKGL